MLELTKDKQSEDMADTSTWQRLKHQLIDLSIRLKIIAPYLILTFIVLGVGVFGAARLVAGSLDERLNNYLVAAGRGVSDSLARQELNNREVGRAIAYTDGFIDALEDRNARLIKALAEPIAINNQLDCLIVFDRQGEQLLHLLKKEATLDSVARQFDIQDIWIIHTLLESPPKGLVSQPGIGQHPISGDYYYFTAMPVWVEDDLVGVVTLGTALKNFLPVAKSVSLADVTIYLQGGQAVASTFTQLSSSEVPTVTLESLAIPPEVYDERVVTPEWTFFGNLEVGDQEYRQAFGPLYLGDESLGVFSVALPTDFIYTAGRATRNTYIAIIMVAAVAVIWLGYVVASRITQPLQRLVHTSVAVAEGDLKQRTGIVSGDEIGTLARTFDQMTARLAARTEDLKTSLRIQREMASRMRSILSSIGDGVLLEDQEGAIEPLNAAAEMMLQTMAANFTFAPLQELHIPEQSLQDDADENPWLLESRRFQVGEKVFTAHSASVLTDDGESLGTVVVLRDVTAEVEAEQLKDAFVEHVSHELRTPLTVIKGYSSLLLATAGSSLNEQQKLFLQTIVTNTESLVAMINALLDFSEMEATGKLGLRQHPLDLGDLVAEVSDELRDQMEEKDLAFLVEIAPNLPEVDGDKERLRLALRNLIRNAWQYTEEGGSVTVRVTVQDQQVVVDVMDTGVGISSDDQRRIFSRFYRAMRVREDERRGLGLGLYVTKAIVTAHKGHIELESQENVGSTFSMSIPALPPPEDGELL